MLGYTKGCDLVDANWPESEIIGYPLTTEEQAETDKAVANARQADVAIVVLGGGQRTCGENKSRSSLDLSGRQLQLLQAIQATRKIWPVSNVSTSSQARRKTLSSPSTASTNPEDAKNVLDGKTSTIWQGNKEDYITFALENGIKIDKVSIAFTRDN